MSRGVRARGGAFAVVGAVACAIACSSASAATVQTGPRTNPLMPFSRIGNDTVTDSNWAGYAVEAASGTKFTDVKGSWVEPSVSCTSSGSSYASFWAGIDGYASSSVEQLGTDSDCTGRNRPSYYAWYEMYPANSVDLSTKTYPVAPGDTLSAEVSVSGTTFTLSLSDSPKGWTFTTTQTGSGLAQSSAELVGESPEICYFGGFYCTLASLSNFGTMQFSGAQAAVNGGGDQPFTAFGTNNGPHAITAETSNGTQRMVPSGLTASPSGSTDAFSLMWKHS